MELWFWKRLEDLHEDTDAGSAITDLTDTRAHAAAAARINELYDDAGERYSDAVRRCIFGLDHRELNLESDDFKREVCQKVIGPLEENLAFFCS